VSALPKPYRDAADAAARHIGEHWQPFLTDVFMLDQAGALGGISAIVAERLAMVREDVIKDAIPGRLAITRLQHGGLRDRRAVVEAAALLAAEIDRDGLR
jgi:hypothetical protein